MAKNKNKYNNRKKKNPHRINEEIRAKKVRMVGKGFDGPTEMTKEEAMELAEEQGLDLVEMADKRPPICKLMDYGKYLYEKNKKPKQPKPKPMKEMRFTPNTGEGDIEFKTRHIVKFLEKGHKVKIFVFFRGREMAFQDRGKELLLKVTESVSDYGVAENLPKMEGRKMHMTLKPKKTSKNESKD